MRKVPESSGPISDYPFFKDKGYLVVKKKPSMRAPLQLNQHELVVVGGSNIGWKVVKHGWEVYYLQSNCLIILLLFIWGCLPQTFWIGQLLTSQPLLGVHCKI